MPRQCRICLEEDKKRNLVAPCSCKGTSKYAHSECLMQWFLHQPSKGLFCSLCLDELARTFARPVEDTTGLPHFNKPYAAILLYHCFCLAFLSRDAYMFLQVILSVMFCAHNYGLYRRVKDRNKTIYLRGWLKKWRWVLPFVHLFVFFTIPFSYWLGGISGNLLLWVYLEEHKRILEEMNEANEMVFISLDRLGLPSFE